MFKNKKSRKILACILTLALISPISTVSYGDTNVSPKIERISGSDRFETSINISKTIYNNSKDIVLVNGYEFPDGITGGVLASSLGGPLLLTTKDKLVPSIENEIKRLSPKNIYILGGKASISENIEKKLKDNKYNVIRLGGINRYDTAKLVADKIMSISGTDTIGLANGSNFADALSSTALLSRSEIPLLLTTSEYMPDETSKFIKDNNNLENALIFGGQSSVSIKQGENLSKDLNITRFKGENRFRTSYEIAHSGFAYAETVILVSGNEFPDALASAPLATKRFAPILLASANNIDKSVMSYITKAKRIIFVGGEKSLSSDLYDDIIQYNHSSIHKVLKVEDNNTLLINYFGKEEKLRLIGAEFPNFFSNDKEKERRIRKESRQYLEDLVLNKNITLKMDIMQRDQNGNLLGYVFLDDEDNKMVNETMLSAGQLQAIPMSPNTKYSKRFLSAENDAKDKNLGFWRELPSDNAEKKAKENLIIEYPEENKEIKKNPNTLEDKKVSKEEKNSKDKNLKNK